MKNIDCTEFEILISAAIDGELDPREFTELESHVDECEHCRHEYTKMEALSDLLVSHDAAQDVTKRNALVLSGESFCKQQGPIEKQLVETSGRECLPVAVNGHSHAATSNLNNTKSKSNIEPTSNRGRNFLAGGMLAATAAGLAALLTTTPPDTLPPEVSLTEVVVPAERATALNEKSHSLQASQTKALAQEVRILKAMLQSHDSESEEVALIEEKIEAIEKRVLLLDATTLRP